MLSFRVAMSFKNNHYDWLVFPTVNLNHSHSLQKIQINQQSDNSRHAENSRNQAMNESYFYRKNSDEVKNIQHNRADDGIF